MSSLPPWPVVASPGLGREAPWQLKLKGGSELLPPSSAEAPPSDILPEEEVEAAALPACVGLAEGQRPEGWSELLGINKRDLETLWFDTAGLPPSPPTLPLLPQALGVPSSPSSSSPSSNDTSSPPETASMLLTSPLPSPESRCLSPPLAVPSLPESPSALPDCGGCALESLAGSEVEVREDDFGLPSAPSVRRGPNGDCLRPKSESLLRRASLPLPLLPGSKWTPLNVP